MSELSEPTAIARAQALWKQSWHAIINNDLALASTAEKQVASSDELLAQEEPADLSVYRVDFLAALLYGLRSYDRDSREDFHWGLQRIGEALDFLAKGGFEQSIDASLENSMLMAIDVLESTSEISAGAAEDLRAEFTSIRDSLNVR